LSIISRSLDVIRLVRRLEALEVRIGWTQQVGVRCGVEKQIG
jgi:hypothetical protein